jgi:N-acetylglucosamine kinase-like BadF-type ATPase
MAEYVIGVDIGATKSHLALFDTEGNFVDLGHWGPLNHEVMPGSFTQFEDELKHFAARVLSKHGITMKQVVYSVLGVGGVDTKKQHGIISGILKKLDFEKFTLVNDSFLGIPAGNGSGTGTGICAINGSGCSMAGINKKGYMLQIGGVGPLTADKGGGGYIGGRMLSAVYSELFLKGEPTAMTGLLFEKLGVTSKYDYLDKVMDKTDDGTFNIHAGSRIIFEAVSQGDPVASGILHEIAANYANGISCMIEELRFPPEDELLVVFAGSVFVKGEHPLLVDSLKAKISADNPDHRITYKLLDVPNVAGAVIWALNSINSKGAYYKKVCEQLRG